MIPTARSILPFSQVVHAFWKENGIFVRCWEGRDRLAQQMAVERAVIGGRKNKDREQGGVREPGPAFYSAGDMWVTRQSHSLRQDWDCKNCRAASTKARAAGSR